ncbi:MAG: tyrosine-type recombinase/integrase [Azonexus sp.]|nr:tyrosine-type recombinase/integrase [Azonexus sp.]MDZ4314325.1 tyrosine-type recombinase/integrase [Azonexus sp.]
MGKITNVELLSWIKAKQPVAKADGLGLTFTLSASGKASWVLRYRHGGKAREKTLGGYPELSLAEARKLTMADRAKIQQGADVAAEKQKVKRDVASAWTFRNLAEDHLKKAEGRLAKTTLEGRRQQLRDYVFPLVGNRPARSIEPHELATIAERVMTKSSNVARLVLVAIRAVYAHGVAKNAVDHDPCVSLRANAILGARPARRQRLQLTDGELRVLLTSSSEMGVANGLMVKILLATATRIGELVNARWEHVDFQRREWVIPPENSKNKKQFVIPLSDLACLWFVELKEISFGSAYVLPIRQKKKSFDDAPMEPVTLNAAINKFCKKVGEEQCRRFTPHDLRSTARSYFGALGVDFLIAERCLNHTLSALAEIYDKHDYIDERRLALEKWSALLGQLSFGKNEHPPVLSVCSTVEDGV